MSYNLDEMLNKEEELVVCGENFKIRELSLAERIGLDSVFKKVLEKAKSISESKDMLALVEQELDKKESLDFDLIKAALDPCNPEKPFTTELFERMSRTQVTQLQNIILKKNYFLDLIGKKEVKETV